MKQVERKFVATVTQKKVDCDDECENFLEAILSNRLMFMMS